MRCSLSPLPSFLPTPSVPRAESPLSPALGSPQSWVVSKLEPGVLPPRMSVLCTCPKWPKPWGDPGRALGSHKDAQVVPVPPGSPLITKHFTVVPPPSSRPCSSLFLTFSNHCSCLLVPFPCSPPPYPLPSHPASSPAEPPVSLSYSKLSVAPHSLQYRVHSPELAVT